MFGSSLVYDYIVRLIQSQFYVRLNSMKDGKTPESKYTIGQVIHHKKFNYRGVIVDVDPVFSGTQKWYDEVAKSRPPKDRPWYHVLVENSLTQTYVAERHLEEDTKGGPVNNPAIELFFSGFKDGLYIIKKNLN